MDFFARIIEVKGGTRIKLQLWDTGNSMSTVFMPFKPIFILIDLSNFAFIHMRHTAGQERFRSITKSYYRNSVGVLLVYDITNHASFEHIPLWMMEAKRHIEPHRPVFALTGCKLDLVSNGAQREVSRDEAKAFAEQNGLFFVETSARTGVNVEEVFNMVTQEVCFGQ